MGATPEETAAELAVAITAKDAARAFLAVAPGAWPRRVEPLFVTAVKRDQRLEVTGRATTLATRAAVPCALVRPGRAPAKLSLLVARATAGEESNEPNGSNESNGGWRVVGVESEAALVAAWLRGYIEAGTVYRDLPPSPLGVAIAARLIAAAAQGEDLARALGDESASAMVALPILAQALRDKRRRAAPLPAREHTLLGRIAVGFELVEIGGLASEELWLILEDRGQGPGQPFGPSAGGPKVLATVSYIALSLVLADHGTGLPAPVPGRTPAPAPAPPVFGDAFERAVLAAVASPVLATGEADHDDLFARAVKASGQPFGPSLAASDYDPWAALTAELTRSLASATPDTDREHHAPGDAPDPVMTTEALVARVRAALGGYLEPFAGARERDPGFVRDHLQGLVGAAFQALAPILRGSPEAPPS